MVESISSGISPALFYFSNNPILHTCLVSVSNHWNLTSNTYKLKKNQAVNLIKDWLKEGCTNNNTPFQVPPELQDYFSKSSKKDDLADSLLMGLAFLEWLKSAVHLLENSYSAGGQNFISTVQKSTTLIR